MKLVRAGFGVEDYDAPSDSSEFGRIGAGDDLEVTDRVQVRQDRNFIQCGVGIRRAIKEYLAVERLASVDAEVGELSYAKPFNVCLFGTNPSIP